MDNSEEPPKLTRKTVDASKRVSYLMESEKMQPGPKPMPRTRRKSTESFTSVKNEAISFPLQTHPPMSTNLEFHSGESAQTQVNNNVIDQAVKNVPSPTTRPRPKPRTRIPSKGNLRDLDRVEKATENTVQTTELVPDSSPLKTNLTDVPESRESKSSDEVLKKIQLANQILDASLFRDSDHIVQTGNTSKFPDNWAQKVTDEDLFIDEPAFLNNGTSKDDVSVEEDKEENENFNSYIFPDGSTDKKGEVTSIISPKPQIPGNKASHIPMSEEENKTSVPESDTSALNVQRSEEFNFDTLLDQSGPSLRNHQNAMPEGSSSLSHGAESMQQPTVQPRTQKPLDLKPYAKSIPFDSEPETAAPTQVALRSSDLLIFDPLTAESPKSNPAMSENEKLNKDNLKLSLNSTMPAPESVLSAPFSPGSYISLQVMENLEEKNKIPNVPPRSQKNTSTSLKYAASFHFAAPECPPPPLPRVQSQSCRDSIPPPIPPRPRPSNLSPKPSHRSLPPSSIGTSSGVSVSNIRVDQPAAVTSAVLDDLPTPVFTPIESDPFSNTGFDDVCYTFNKSHGQPESSSSMAFGAAGATAAAVSTPSPAGPAPAAVADQEFEVDFESAFGAQSTPTPSPFEECLDPERISRFVIPPPGSLALELSSTDESDTGDDQGDSDLSDWSIPPGLPSDLTLASAGNLSQKKTTRYGYLYKQGGYNANKGWKKRWVVFNGTSLSYYDSNTSQVSKRIIPVACMNDVGTDVKKTNEKHGFKFKVVTSLKDRVFIFSAETLEECLTWANSLMAAITEHRKSGSESDDNSLNEKPDKEGFIKFHAMKRYYVVIRGNIMSYYQSFQDFEMGSPIHQMDMKLASVKVKDRRRFKLQLWLHYGHFDLTLESETDMQSWRMAIEDSIAEGLADDTVLEKVYQNLSNQQCADCGDKNPHWASINLGVVLCKNCAGIHRMFDYRVSKVRSLRMDTRVWTPSLIELMVTIGNANANAFWESKLSADAKLHPQVAMDTRKEYISHKYLQKNHCDLHPLMNEKPLLGEELVKVASTDNVLEAMQVLFSGADILYRKDGNDGRTAYEISKELGQRLVMELLYQNGGDPQSIQENIDDENRLREDVRLQGYLNKAGPGGKTFEKRWCILEHGTLTYYQNEKSVTSRGFIDRKNMMLLQKVHLDRPGHHFEISTDTKDQRTYAFSSDSDQDAGEWMRTIAKLMSPVAVMEHVGMLDIKFAGYGYYKKSLQSEWYNTFFVFVWRGLYHMNKDLKLDYLDLRKATSIKLQEPEDGFQLATEKGPCFVIGFSGMSVYIQAPLARDTERIFVALESAAKCSGTTLLDQVLTSENVPVIIDKCITHISKEGLHEEGIYRQAAQMSKVDSLLKEFHRDATAVSFGNCTVHEVANAMKKFLRELDDSVFERINYPLWIGSAGLKDSNNRLMWYKYYLDKMSSVNYHTLKRIIVHLIQVSRYESSNHMTIQNLATCFAPSLMRTIRDESNFMSDTPSREINIIIDLLTYHEYFFQLHDEEISKKEKQIEEAERKIKERLKSANESSAEKMKSILIPVYMINPDGQAVNISVTDSIKVKDAMDYFRKSKATSHINTSSFGMCELIFKGTLVRPLLPDELMGATVRRWMEWEPWVSADNSISLCAREMDLLYKLDEHSRSSSTHILLSKLYYSDASSKRFKRIPMGFRQCRLALYSNLKDYKEIVSWPVENLIFYFGHSARKNAPSKHCLTFLVEGEKCSKNQGIFGHCISFDTEDELYRWASAFFLAQNPKGLLVWNTRS